MQVERGVGQEDSGRACIMSGHQLKSEPRHSKILQRVAVIFLVLTIRYGSLCDSSPRSATISSVSVSRAAALRCLSSVDRTGGRAANMGAV